MIKAVFAVDSNCGIGYQNRMPWPSNSDDMKWFKTVTKGQVVVMGRNTWESPDMPTPLPDRLNIVFSSTLGELPTALVASGDVGTCLRKLDQMCDDDIIVIGGANLLEKSAHVLEQVHVTRIPGSYECDTFVDLEKIVGHLTLDSITNLGTCVVEHYVKETK